MFKSAVSLLGTFLVLGSLALAAPSTLTYQGRIVKSDGKPLEYAHVSFLFQITSPNGLCVLYEEQVNNVNMVNSGGVFDTPIGSGSRTFPSSGSANLLDAFNNLAPSLACLGGSTYAPAANDTRRLRVQFHDGSGWKVISPDNIIRSVPYAGFSFDSVKLAGHEAQDFLLKNTLMTCSGNNFLNWDGTTFTCEPVTGSAGGTVTNVSSANPYLHIVNGTSTPTLTLNVGTTANTVAAGNDSRLSDSRTPTGTAAGDLSGTYPNPSVTKIQGIDVDGATPAQDQVLTFDGSKWIAQALPAASSGSVNSVATGTGLTGGPITSTGTISIDGPLLGLHNMATNGYIFRNGANTYGATTASSAASNDTLVVRDGSGVSSFYGAGLSGATSGQVILQAADISANYSLIFPDTQGANNQVLMSTGASGILTWANMPSAPGSACGAGNVLTYNGTNFVCVPDQTGSAGSGITTLNGQTGSTQSFATPGTSGTAPAWISNGDIHTLNIPLASASSVTAGLISKAQYDVFNAKLGTATAFSGDVTGTYNGTSVGAIKGIGVSATAPSGAGQVLRYNGSATYVPAFLSLADIRSTVNTANTIFPASTCTAAQTLTWSSLTDTMSCTPIGIVGSQITSGSIAVARLPALSGDVTTNASYVATIANNAVTTAKITDANVTTAKIADGAITSAKLAAGVAAASLGYTPVNKSGDTMTGILNLPPGIVTAPSLALGADGDTGIYSPGANQVAITTAGVQRALFDSAGTNISGGLGVRSASPNTSSAINSSFNVSGNATRYGINNLLTIDNTATLTANRPAYGILSDAVSAQTSASLSTYTQTMYGGYLRSRTSATAGSVASTLYGSYNVALHESNTTLPTAIGSAGSIINDSTAAITSATGSYGSISQTVTTVAAGMTTAYGVRSQITNSNTNATMGVMGTGYLYHGQYTGSGTVNNKWGLYLTGEDDNYLSGNLGIGTSSPASKLHVSGGIQLANDAAACAAAKAGTLKYVSGALSLCNGSAWIALSATVGTVTSVATGSGLTGGTITSSGTISVATGGISTEMIADDAVNGEKIAPGAVNVNALGTGAVTSAKIADGAIATVDIADNAVTTAKINTSAVTATELASNAVITAKIADDAVTSAKLATGAAVSNIGYTPVNKAGDTMSGSLTVNANLTTSGTYYNTGTTTGTSADYTGYESATNRGLLNIHYGSAHTSSAGRSIIYGNYVDGNTADGGMIDFGTHSNYLRLTPPGGTSGRMELYSGGSTTLFLNSAGNIGIGHTSPQTLIHAVSDSSIMTLDTHVASTNGASVIFRKARGTVASPANTASGDQIMWIGAKGYGTNGGYSTNADGALAFYAAEAYTSTSRGTNFQIATTEVGTTSRLARFTVYHDGNVGIGTTAPSHILHITGQGRSTNASWATTSDIRLKDIQGEYQYGLDEILNLHTVWFKYKKDNPLKLPTEKKFPGIIAQELQKVIPEAVEQTKDGYLTVNNDPVHWAIVNAVKELYHRWFDDSKEIHRELASVKEQNAQLVIENQDIKKENAEIKKRLEKIEQLLDKNSVGK